MKGDITRQTFRGRNHYRSVLAQQGRVRLDADWNEQVLLQAHLDEVTAADTIGGHGGPLHGAGLKLEPGADGGGLVISSGRYYVDGVVCENEDAVPLDAQPDLPGQALPATDGRYTAYLDVWQEHLSAVERPDLLEVALGGATTTTRARTVWQVRVRAEGDPLPADGDAELTARAVTPADGGSSGATLPASAGFRRLENQLYRVEIHQGGDDATAAFVWSRENGSVAARLLRIDGNQLTVDSPGRDQRLSFKQSPGAWVEVIDLARVRTGTPGPLGRVETVADTRLTIAEWRLPGPGQAPPAEGDFGKGAVVRRWESGARPVSPGTWLGLEDGVQVRFEPGGTFRVGDFWQIPARTANLDGAPVVPDLEGNIDWPRDTDGTPLPQKTASVHHRYAGLATLQRSDGVWSVVSDDRHLYPTLSELGAQVDVEYAGGDGQETTPGASVPCPLCVSVSRAGLPAAGELVRFQASQPDAFVSAAPGTLGLPGSQPTGPDGLPFLDATTGTDGVARCYWRPAGDPGRPSQQVVARWLDRSPAAGGVPRDPPIMFTSAFRLASATTFDPGACGLLQQATTVQDAITRLAGEPILRLIEGDGQSGDRGADLAQPLVVEARSGCGELLTNRGIRFTASSGSSGTLLTTDGARSGDSLDVATDSQGRATCRWRLGGEFPVQTVRAELLFGPDPDPLVAPAGFTAGARAPRPFAPGLHVTSAVLTRTGAALTLGGLVAASDLAQGVSVVLSGAPAPETVDGRRVLAVTLDLPFPFSPADRELWGNAVAGTTPLTLDAQVAVGGHGTEPAITWTPSPASEGLLTGLFGLMTRQERGNIVAGRITLRGQEIAAAGAAGQVVNGLAPVAVSNGVAALSLPSADDVRGADFELPFQLVATIVNLVVVPHRNGRLALKSAQDAIALSMPRGAVRAALPPGVLIATGPPADERAAGQALGRAFRNGTPRRLTLVVTEPYAAAAAPVQEALGRLGIDVEVVPAADPAATAAERLGAGQPVDGILTADADTGPVTAMADFPTPVPL
jgi:hypothetical protein